MMGLAYVRYGDVFHPVMVMAPMCAFLYVYMPWKLISNEDLLNFVSEDQATFYQFLIVLVVGLFLGGMLVGSKPNPSDAQRQRVVSDRDKVRLGAYFFGGIGFACWAYTIHYVGGFSKAFGVAYAGGWSPIGYVNDAAYLTVMALVLLMSREAYNPKSKLWLLAVAACALPWLSLCLLGARRGPTFMLTVCMGMSWFIARGKRPSLFTMIGCGALLGMFMLWLVTNRDHICLQCDLQFTTDMSKATATVDAGNEYIFGTGCVAATQATGRYWWGKRYLAQVTVRPIPIQLWPTKYEDTGLSALTQNAGVAIMDLASILGWATVPGAAGTMVADLWVEFSWLCLPVAFGAGWGMGRVWRLGVTFRGFWMTEYIIFCVLSIYLITQSGEAVIARSLILSLPAITVWRWARIAILPPGAAVAEEGENIDAPSTGRMLHA
jgi:hypothetical protein